MSARSASSAQSDRDFLQQVFMVDDSGRTTVRASKDSVLDIPLTQQPPPLIEYPPDWILLDYPMTQQEHMAWFSSCTHLRKQEWVLEQRRRRDEVGTTLTTVEGAYPYAGERLTLALAANTGTVIDNMLTLLLDIGSNTNIIGPGPHRPSRESHAQMLTILGG